jgi:hypothetical protein
LAGYLSKLGAGVCIDPLCRPVAATAVVTVVITVKFHVVSKLIRVVALNIGKIEKNLVVVLDIVAYLLVP